MLHDTKKKNSFNWSTDRTEANNSDFEFALDRIAMGIGRSNMLVS